MLFRCCQNHVPDLGRILLKAVQYKTDVCAFQLQQAGHYSVRKIFSGHADSLCHQLCQFVCLPYAPRTFLREFIAADIFSNHFLISIHLRFITSAVKDRKATGGGKSRTQEVDDAAIFA